MMNAENAGKIRTELNNRRLAAIAEADRRNEEVRAESPEIRKIDEELTKTGLVLFHAAVSGGDVDAIRRRNRELCDRRAELLVSLGHPKDYTEVKYSCPTCRDTGYDGTVMCSCLRKMLIEENLRTSGLGSLIERQSFENFDLSGYHAEGTDVERLMKRNFDKIRQYAENFRLDSGNLLLIGPTGTGKTHLTTALARTVIERGYSVLYDTAQNVLSVFEDDRFRSGYGEHENKSEKYLECDLLILDDLGTEFTNSFSVSVLYNLFNSRQNRGLPTVISTNLGARELSERYDDRIVSRILGRDYTILQFCGKDRRLSL